MTQETGSSPPEPVAVGAASRTTAVAIAASAGGLSAISRVLGGLHEDLPAAVIVIMHLLPEHRSMLSDVLRRHTGLRVKTAESGDAIEPGCVYVAPPDVHLVAAHDGRLQLDDGPPVHHVRPSADVLLDSLAGVYGDRCVAVVLSGAGKDGASGVIAVKAAGGRVIVQDPASSEHGGMPSAAVATGSADRIVSLEEIAAMITLFVSESRADDNRGA